MIISLLTTAFKAFEAFGWYSTLTQFLGIGSFLMSEAFQAMWPFLSISINAFGVLTGYLLFKRLAGLNFTARKSVILDRFCRITILGIVTYGTIGAGMNYSRPAFPEGSVEILDQSTLERWFITPRHNAQSKQELKKIAAAKDVCGNSKQIDAGIGALKEENNLFRSYCLTRKAEMFLGSAVADYAPFAENTGSSREVVRKKKNTTVSSKEVFRKTSPSSEKKIIVVVKVKGGGSSIITTVVVVGVVCLAIYLFLPKDPFESKVSPKRRSILETPPPIEEQGAEQEQDQSAQEIPDPYDGVKKETFVTCMLPMFQPGMVPPLSQFSRIIQERKKEAALNRTLIHRGNQKDNTLCLAPRSDIRINPIFESDRVVDNCIELGLFVERPSQRHIKTYTAKKNAYDERCNTRAKEREKRIDERRKKEENNPELEAHNDRMKKWSQRSLLRRKKKKTLKAIAAFQASRKERKALPNEGFERDPGGEIISDENGEHQRANVGGYMSYLVPAAVTSILKNSEMKEVVTSVIKLVPEKIVRQVATTKISYGVGARLGAAAAAGLSGGAAGTVIGLECGGVLAPVTALIGGVAGFVGALINPEQASNAADAFIDIGAGDALQRAATKNVSYRYITETVMKEVEVPTSSFVKVLAVHTAASMLKGALVSGGTSLGLNIAWDLASCAWQEEGYSYHGHVCRKYSYVKKVQHRLMKYDVKIVETLVSTLTSLAITAAIDTCTGGLGTPLRVGVGIVGKLGMSRVLSPIAVKGYQKIKKVANTVSRIPGF